MARPVCIPTRLAPRHSGRTLWLVHAHHDMNLKHIQLTFLTLAIVAGMRAVATDDPTESPLKGVTNIVFQQWSESGRRGSVQEFSVSDRKEISRLLSFSQLVACTNVVLRDVHYCFATFQRPSGEVLISFLSVLF